MTNKSGEPPTFERINFDDKHCEYTLVLMGDDGEHFDAFGSGFFIAPGLLMTAKHVMVDFWKRYHYRPFPKRKTETDTDFQVWGLQFLGGKTEQALWYSEKVWISDFTDIAFLYLKPYSANVKSYEWKYPYELSLYAPRKGETITAYGYPKTVVELVQRSPVVTIEWKLAPTKSTGEILKIHERHHSRGWIDFPSIETDARFDNGMSGGPVFNQSGQVCGVVSGGGGTKETGYTSFAALLWLAMLTQLDVDIKTGISISEYLAFELFNDNFIRQSGWKEIYTEKREQYEIYNNDEDELKLNWKPIKS